MAEYEDFLEEMRFPQSDLRHSTDPCYYDESLGMKIHKFNTGSYVCRCGEDNVQAKIDELREKTEGTHSPWQRSRRRTSNPQS